MLRRHYIRKIFMVLILIMAFFFNANVSAASEVRFINRTAEEILNDSIIIGNERAGYRLEPVQPFADEMCYNTCHNI